MVSVSVSKKIGIEKSIGIGFEKNLVSEKVSVLVSKKIGIGKSIGIGFENFWYRKKVSVLVSKKFGIEKSIGIGIGKILVSKKVSVLVSKKIGIGKKYRYRYRSDFGFRHTLLLTCLVKLGVAKLLLGKNTPPRFSLLRHYI